MTTLDPARSDSSLVLLARHRLTFDERPDGLLAAQWLRNVEADDTATFTQWSGPVSIDGAVPYRRYRSSGPADPTRPVGCVVLVAVEFDRAGVAEEWVDLVFEALAAEEDPHPGGISGHFHIGLDGTRALNYAEWTSAAAHREAVSRGNGVIGLNPLWQRVRSFRGLVRSDVRRYAVTGTL